MKDFFNSVKYVMKLTFTTSKLYTVIRLLSDLFSTAATLISAYFSKLVIDEIAAVKGKESVSIILVYVAFIVAFQIIQLVNSKIKMYCTTVHSDIISNKITQKIMNITLTSDIEFFDSEEFYNSFETVKNDMYQLPGIIWNIISLFSSIVSVVAALVMFGNVNIFMGLIIIAASVPVAFSEKNYSKEVYMYELEHIEEQRKMGYVSGLASGRDFAQEVRLYDIGGAINDKFMSLWNPYFRTKKRIIKTRTLKNSFFASMPYVIIGGVLIYLVFGIADGKYTIGDFSFYSGIAFQLVQYMLIFIGSVAELYEKKLMINNLNNFNKRENKIKDNGTREFDGHDVKIEFKNVVFRYPNTDVNALDGISFTIENGEHIALVGINGAGKSTVIKLLLRFYDVTSGEILINNYNIKEYKLQELRRKFSTLFQQFTTLSLTARENIDLAGLNCPSDEQRDKEITEALEKAQGSDVLESLGMNLDTYIGKVFDDDGVELSGGQKQKIAIARAFFRNADMIMLDEPSSALDPEAEHRLFEILEKLTEHKTSLFTSHRLSNISYADKILVIENGKKLEFGTHEQLMRDKSRYSQLFGYQAAKYKISEESCGIEESV